MNIPPLKNLSENFSLCQNYRPNDQRDLIVKLVDSPQPQSILDNTLENASKCLKSPRKFFASIQLSPRPPPPLLYFENSINSFTTPLSIQHVSQIDKIFSTYPYEIFSLQELKQASLTGWLNVIKQTVNDKKTNYLYLMKGKKESDQNYIETIKKSIDSHDFILLKLIFSHLQHYYTAMKTGGGLYSSNLLTKTNKIIEAILNTNTDYFCLPSKVSLLEFLILALKKTPLKFQTTLTYILFANRDDCLNSFLTLLREWYDLSNEKIITSIDHFLAHPLYETEVPKNYKFEEETIVRSFVPDQMILPKRVFINSRPLKLIYSGEHKEVFFNFFSTFFNEIKYLNQCEDDLEMIVNKFYEENSLPDYLKNLLGISTVSSRLMAYKFLDEIYPELRNNGQIVYKEKKAETEIFYHIDSNQISCTLPLVCTIYPKLFPHEVDSMHHDENRPLALFLFEWTSYLEGSKDYTHSTLQFIKLNFLASERGLQATKEEKKLIERILRLRRLNVKEKIYQIFNRITH